MRYLITVECNGFIDEGFYIEGTLDQAKKAADDGTFVSGNSMLRIFGETQFTGPYAVAHKLKKSSIWKNGAPSQDYESDPPDSYDPDAEEE